MPLFVHLILWAVLPSLDLHLILRCQRLRKTVLQGTMSTFHLVRSRKLLFRIISWWLKEHDFIFNDIFFTKTVPRSLHENLHKKFQRQIKPWYSPCQFVPIDTLTLLVLIPCLWSLNSSRDCHLKTARPQTLQTLKML